MKIGIDAFGCDHARSGLGTYLLSFVGSMNQSDDVKFELFGSELDRYTYTSGKDVPYSSVSISDSLRSERLWHFFSANKFEKSQGYNVVLYPAPERVFPVRFKTPGIAVVNSVISSVRDVKENFLQRWQTCLGLSKVQKIIAATTFIRMDLIRNGIDSNKIEVVNNGIDHKLFFPQLNMSDDFVDVKPFAIRKPYFIYGSRLSGPEKKHVELIKAFSEFKRRTGASHRLVIAGSDGLYSEEVHKAAFESPYASDIFLTGYFPHESFPQLYAGSEALVFPAINEGVGLPVLEAMATGVPVACANSGALPEISGGATMLFNPDDENEFANVLEKIASDKQMCSEMVKKGLERAASFNWENTVRQTVEIAKSLLK